MKTEMMIPPALKTDEGVELTETARTERAVVWNLIRHLVACGFEPVEAAFDGESVATPTPEAMMEAAFGGEDWYCFFRKPGHNARRWFQITLGNGADVVGDWTAPHIDADGWGMAMQSFDFERFWRSSGPVTGTDAADGSVTLREALDALAGLSGAVTGTTRVIADSLPEAAAEIQKAHGKAMEVLARARPLLAR